MSVSSKNHVSGFTKQATPSPPPPPPPKRKVNKPHRVPIRTPFPPSSRPTTETPFWEGKLTVGDHQLRRGFAGEIKTVEKANNKVVISDPTGLSSDTVIKTTYNKVRLTTCFISFYTLMCIFIWFLTQFMVLSIFFTFLCLCRDAGLLNKLAAGVLSSTLGLKTKTPALEMQLVLNMKSISLNLSISLKVESCQGSWEEIWDAAVALMQAKNIAGQVNKD